MPLPPAIPQHRVGITLDPYIVAGFQPRAMPPVAVLGQTMASVGTADVSDALSDQLSVDMGATCRWVADPASLHDMGDGTFRWVPSQGIDTAGVYWKFDAASVPTYDPTYNYKIPGAHDPVNHPAFLLTGGVWAELVGFPDHLAGFTVAIVARLRGTNGGPYANIFASKNDSTDPDVSSDTALQMRAGGVIRTVTVGKKYSLMDITDTGRPQLLDVRQGNQEVYTLTGDNNWQAKRYYHDPVTHYDMSWYLGRDGNSYHNEKTLLADVLDICLWSWARTDASVRYDSRKLNGIYHVVK